MDQSFLVTIFFSCRCGLGRWTVHNSRLWSVIISPTLTSWIKLSVARHIITSSVCPDIWVDVFTHCMMLNDSSNSVSFRVAVSFFLSRWKFRSPTISRSPELVTLSWRKVENSLKNCVLVNLFFWLGGGLYKAYITKLRQRDPVWNWISIFSELSDLYFSELVTLMEALCSTPTPP